MSDYDRMRREIKRLHGVCREIREEAEIKQINAVINFAFFSLQFPNDFIDKCWGDPENKSLVPKLKSILDKENKICITASAFITFFTQLDNLNQQRLIEWINANYKAFSHLKM